MGDTFKDGKNCKKYRPMHEYSRIQELIDNLPYILMIILGAIIFLIGFEMSIPGWIAAGLYVLYGIIGAFIIILFVCPYCHYYDTKGCPCGYGRIAPKLRLKKDENRFMEKFKKYIRKFSKSKRQYKSGQ